MTKQLEQLTPDTPASLQYTPDFQASVITIRGDHDVLVDVNTDLDALEARLLAQNDKVSASVGKAAVEAPVSVTDLNHADMSALPTMQTAKLKVSAFIYDRLHKTNMLGLLNERIDTDRNVRFATELGLLSVEETYCRKHEKAVAKLKQLV